MKKYSFRGGVHPLEKEHHGKQYTDTKPIRKIDAPDILHIPMKRLIGAPAKPLVKKGDKVLVGQLIGEAQGFVSTNVHSSVSGKVKFVKNMPHQIGSKELSVIIENDHEYTVDPNITPTANWEDLSGPKLLELVKQMGIVGMGGAMFPTHVKLTPPPEFEIDLLILNGAECEPYLTADHRLMLEDPQNVVDGVKMIKKIIPTIKKCYIAIETNKMDAIESISKHSKGVAEIAPLVVKYPQGAEKQLIDAITKRKVPRGGLPMHIGALVVNVGTAAAIANGVKTGMPPIERIVTVSGSAVTSPDNLMAPIGTSFEYCIEQCGGYKGEVGKIISGGPMMGTAQPDDQATVLPGTSGIMVISPEESKIEEPTNCIRCGRCVEGCPVGLLPLSISRAIDVGDLEKAEKLNAMDCVECGSCAYICPSRRYLLQSIRLVKTQIRNKSK